MTWRYLNSRQLHEAVAELIPGMKSRNSFERILPGLPFVSIPGAKSIWYDLDVVMAWIAKHMVYPDKIPAPSLHRRRPRRAAANAAIQ